MSIFGSIENWFRKPFDSQGSAFGWFLFFGLLLLIAFTWGKILRGIQVAIT
jgi:hypothetical protein